MFSKLEKVMGRVAEKLSTNKVLVDMLPLK